jgi:hypothetical protein
LGGTLLGRLMACHLTNHMELSEVFQVVSSLH